MPLIIPQSRSAVIEHLRWLLAQNCLLSDPFYLTPLYSTSRRPNRIIKLKYWTHQAFALNMFAQNIAGKNANIIPKTSKQQFGKISVGRILVGLGMTHKTKIMKYIWWLVAPRAMMELNLKMCWSGRFVGGTLLAVDTLLKQNNFRSTLIYMWSCIAQGSPLTTFEASIQAMN